MRLKINFKKNTEKVPNNQSIVNGYIHKCLGKNNQYHDSKSNYCISGLLGGNIIDGGLYSDYSNGGYILVTSSDIEFLDKLSNGILNNQYLGYGMTFNGIDFINEDVSNGWNYFKTTPLGFILKEKSSEDGKNIGFFDLKNPNIELMLKNQIINKFSKINPEFDFSTLVVGINKHPSHKIKNIWVKNVKNVANVCQINIYTNKKLAQAIYDYGIGQSTGSGFGTVFLTKNSHIYNNK